MCVFKMKVHLLVNELYIYQYAQCNIKKELFEQYNVGEFGGWRVALMGLG